MLHAVTKSSPKSTDHKPLIPLQCLFLKSISSASRSHPIHFSCPPASSQSEPLAPPLLCLRILPPLLRLQTIGSSDPSCDSSRWAAVAGVLLLLITPLVLHFIRCSWSPPSWSPGLPLSCCSWSQPCQSRGLRHANLEVLVVLRLPAFKMTLLLLLMILRWCCCSCSHTLAHSLRLTRGCDGAARDLWGHATALPAARPQLWSCCFSSPRFGCCSSVLFF